MEQCYKCDSVLEYNHLDSTKVKKCYNKKCKMNERYLTDSEWNFERETRLSNMKLLELEQGTQEWLDVRKDHFTASNAPAMMGASKYKSRDQLLAEQKSGITEKVTPVKQALFDKGHKAEDNARSLLELETMDSYLPCVGVSFYTTQEENYTSTLKFMASFDGRSDMEDHLFEHKLWNETLAENVRNKILEPFYYWQLEHQLLVSEDEYVLFVVSDGTSKKREMMKYRSIPDRREKLIAGWRLFQSDLDSYEVKAKQEVLVAKQKHLPVLKWQVSGTEVTTNISSCLVEIKKIAAEELNRPFETDQDFADKEKLNKDVKKLREALKQNVASVKSNFISYSEFEKIASEMDEILQKMYSVGEKQVKKAKEEKKEALKNEAIASLSAHVDECNKRIAASFSIDQVIKVNPDWALAMKNKRTIDSLKNSLDVVLNEWKLQLNKATDLIAMNFKFLQENASEYKFLFQDIITLINQQEELFKATVTTRINDYKKIEAEKLATKTAEIKQKAEEEAERKLTTKEQLIDNKPVSAPTNEELNLSLKRGKICNRSKDIFDFCSKYQLGTDAIVELDALLEKHIKANIKEK